jgi:hypothetical protein
VQAVEIEAIESDFFGALRKRVVVSPQPLDELDHHFVSPHPRREAAKIGKRFHGIDVNACATDIAVEPISVRPICLHCDGDKVLFRN